MEKRGKLTVIRGLPRGEILAGRPDAAEAFQKWREKGNGQEKAKRQTS
jgi:hypothetical protein